MRSKALPGVSPPTSTGRTTIGVVSKGAGRVERRTGRDDDGVEVADHEERRADAPHHPRADGHGDRAGSERADQRERLHEAAEHGEDLASALVRDDLLDQGHVADETDAVTDPEDDGADAPDREVRADGADRHAGGGDQERGAVAAVDGQPLDEPERRRRCRSGCRRPRRRRRRRSRRRLRRRRRS